MENYSKCFKEVYETLKHLSKEEYKKIPEDIINNLQENMDSEYEWNYDILKPITEQNISRKAVAILSYININYLLNEEQKELMEKIHKANEQKIEREKQEKYNANDLFKNKIEPIANVNDETKNVKMTKYKESIFKRIINKIKNIFRKNK